MLSGWGCLTLLLLHQCARREYSLKIVNELGGRRDACNAPDINSGVHDICVEVSSSPSSGTVKSPVCTNTCFSTRAPRGRDLTTKNSVGISYNIYHLVCSALQLSTHLPKIFTSTSNMFNVRFIHEPINREHYMSLHIVCCANDTICVLEHQCSLQGQRGWGRQRQRRREQPDLTRYKNIGLHLH